jgi:hypothetical protein
LLDSRIGDGAGSRGGAENAERKPRKLSYKAEGEIGGLRANFNIVFKTGIRISRSRNLISLGGNTDSKLI